MGFFIHAEVYVMLSSLLFFLYFFFQIHPLIAKTSYSRICSLMHCMHIFCTHFEVHLMPYHSLLNFSKTLSNSKDSAHHSSVDCSLY